VRLHLQKERVSWREGALVRGWVFFKQIGIRCGGDIRGSLRGEGPRFERKDGGAYGYLGVCTFTHRWALEVGGFEYGEGQAGNVGYGTFLGEFLGGAGVGRFE
jgi:hypothetical protein